MTEKYGSGRFCCKSCANTRQYSEKSKQNISNGSKKSKILISQKLKNKKYCKFCSKEIINRNESKFCSDNCRIKQNQVPALIKYFGFNKELLGTEKVFDEWNRTRETLYDLYWTQEKTTIELCKMFNYPNFSNLTHKVFKYTCKNCIRSCLYV